MKLAYRIISGVLLVGLIIGISPIYKGLAAPDTEILRPNAVGDESFWLPFPNGGEDNYEDVDEVIADGDATYVYGFGQTPGQSWIQDLYNITNSTGWGEINSITVHARFKGIGVGDADVAKIIMKTGGIVYESSAKTITAGYVDYTEQWPTNPDTGQRWAWGEIDILQIGISFLTQDLPPSRLLPRCTQAYVVIDYTPTTSDISNALYYGTIIVSNNSTATTNVAVNCTISTQTLIDGGYLNSSANNCALRSSGGVDIAFMPSVNASDPWVIWVGGIGADSSQSNILYTAESTGGKVFYFPGDTGMVVVDVANLEPGDNFTHSITGFFSTDSTVVGENITGKGLDFLCYVAGTDNISAGLPTDNTTFQKQETEDNSDGIGDLNWYATSFTPTSSHYLVAVELHVRKVGVPTEDFTVGIRRTAAGKPTGGDLTSYTSSVSSWNVASRWELMTMNRPLYVEAGTMYAIVLRLPAPASGGDGRWSRRGADVYAGGTRISSGDSGTTWTIDGAKDMTWREYGGFIGVTGAVSSGEYKLKVYADTVNMYMEIDDVVVDTNTLSANITNNSDNWTIAWGAAVPYMATANITVDGVARGSWEWEYDTTFTDLSGNGNDATPTFRTTSSDADVSAVFTSFLPISEAKAPAYALGEAPAFIETVPTIVSEFDTTPPAGTFPLAGVITTVATATDTPPQLPLLLIAIFVIVACSLAISATMRRYGSGSLLPKIATITAVMGVFIALGDFGIDFWMLVVFLIIAIALSMGSKQVGWQ